MQSALTKSSGHGLRVKLYPPDQVDARFKNLARGRSSVGRALDWQSRGSWVRVPSPPPTHPPIYSEDGAEAEPAQQTSENWFGPTTKSMNVPRRPTTPTTTLSDLAATAGGRRLRLLRRRVWARPPLSVPPAPTRFTGPRLHLQRLTASYSGVALRADSPQLSSGVAARQRVDSYRCFGSEETLCSGPDVTELDGTV